MSETRIPTMEFIENVDKTLNVSDPMRVLRNLDERLQKYRYIEVNLLQKRAAHRRQLPNFGKSIEMIGLLEEKKEMTTHFVLSSQVHTKARIPPTDKVCLWLGANTMLECPLGEAKELLTKNMNLSLKNLEQIESDLEFLRNQITTAEVNLARLYNHNVKRMQEAGLDRKRNEETERAKSISLQKSRVEELAKAAASTVERPFVTGKSGDDGKVAAASAAKSPASASPATTSHITASVEASTTSNVKAGTDVEEANVLLPSASSN